MEQKEIADFVIKDLHSNHFWIKGWVEINSEKKWGWGIIANDSQCFPMTYNEAEAAILEIRSEYPWAGKMKICNRVKKRGITLDKAT